MTQAIVVGGGLGGLSAAHTVLENGGKVFVIDKAAFFGGNSTKATSGMNGSGTRTQRAKGINDSPEIFMADTVRGGATNEKLAHTLVYESGPGVEWLIDNFGLDLSLVSRLGGHSQERTHRGKEKFPGMTITYALMEKLEKIAEEKDGRAEIALKARVTKLLTEGGKVVGVEYEQGGQKKQVKGTVILATGGYGADFEKDSILAQVNGKVSVDGTFPDMMKLSTTNGDHCTGDGIKMGVAIGAETVDLNWVQVHPTGLVHPDEPDAKVKFLAAEALRGCGAIILDKHGKRIANELGRRDYVSCRMWKSEGPFRLVLNSKASTEIAWHCKHYKGRRVMKQFKTGADLAKEMGLAPEVLDKTFKEYNEIAQKMEKRKDENEGPYKAYGGGMSYDPWGKKFFHNYPIEVADTFHVAIIEPCIHYCMGGLKVNEHAEVLGKDGPIPGLFGAGEVNGGIHGQNRLGGSSLLDCVAYGRVAGRSASKLMFSRACGVAKL